MAVRTVYNSNAVLLCVWYKLSEKNIVCVMLYTWSTFVSSCIYLQMYHCTLCCKKEYTHNTQPFYGSVEFVQDNPGEPVPEETFTHSHSSWSSIIPICFLHLLRTMASSVFNPRSLQSFSTISLQWKNTVWYISDWQWVVANCDCLYVKLLVGVCWCSVVACRVWTMP